MYFKINSIQEPAEIVESIIEAGVPDQSIRVEISSGSLYVNGHYICSVEHDHPIVQFFLPSDLNKLIRMVENDVF